MGNNNSHASDEPVPVKPEPQYHVGDILEYSYGTRNEAKHYVKITCSKNGKRMGNGTIKWRHGGNYTYTGPIDDCASRFSNGFGIAELETPTYRYAGQICVRNNYRYPLVLFDYALADGSGNKKYKEGNALKTIVGNIVEIDGVFCKNEPNGLSRCIMDDGKNVYCVWNCGTLMSHYDVAEPILNNIIPVCNAKPIPDDINL